MAELLNTKSKNIPEQTTIMPTVTPKMTNTTRDCIKMAPWLITPIRTSCRKTKHVGVEKRYTKASNLPRSYNSWGVRIDMRQHSDNIANNVERGPDNVALTSSTVVHNIARCRTPHEIASRIRSEGPLSVLTTNDLPTFEPQTKASYCTNNKTIKT